MTIHQIVGWCLQGLTLSLALGLLACLLGVGWAMRYEGIRILSVQSGSMLPALALGDAVVSVPISLTTLKPGDIVSYQRSVSGAIISHRIVAVNSYTKTFTTKGDHNAYPDDPVPSSQLVGRSIAVLPAAGRLFGLIRRPLALIALIYVPATILIVLETRRFQINSVRPYRLAHRYR